jgi:hypothetical protein
MKEEIPRNFMAANRKLSSLVPDKAAVTSGDTERQRLKHTIPNNIAKK